MAKHALPAKTHVYTAELGVSAHGVASFNKALLSSMGTSRTFGLVVSRLAVVERPNFGSSEAADINDSTIWDQGTGEQEGERSILAWLRYDQANTGTVQITHTAEAAMPGSEQPTERHSRLLITGGLIRVEFIVEPGTQDVPDLPTESAERFKALYEPTPLRALPDVSIQLNKALGSGMFRGTLELLSTPAGNPATN